MKQLAGFNTSQKNPFWFGGAASAAAACCTHPLDLIKVRLQNQPANPQRLSIAQTIIYVARGDGVTGFYRGLSASLVRQLTYSTTRFGSYETLKDALWSDSQPPVSALVVLGCVSGVLGGLAGNPADVVSVRMQQDGALPPTERRNYSGPIRGAVNIFRTEGFVGLGRGVGPNCIRAALMTASQLASYDAVKRFLCERDLGRNGSVATHLISSATAAVVATTVCSPFDVVKTRVMSAPEGTGKVLHVLTHSFRTDGSSWMFRGWWPSFVRLGPQTVLTLVALEQLKRVYHHLGW